jgi:hypothetical protein
MVLVVPGLGAERANRQSEPLGDVCVGDAFGGQQHDLGLLDVQGWRLGGSRSAAQGC